jgi:hypothetical protein
MTKMVISENLKEDLRNYLKNVQGTELVSTYLFFVEKKFQLHPVLFVRDKIIYQSSEDAIKALEKENKLWHQAEIKISLGQTSVNEQTAKIYICPFTGKVFGDNTHPNPQDAIYDWVSKCPENKERIGGLKVKRFFVSEDPEVIKSYMAKVKPKEPVVKIVYSSVLNGKLYSTKQAVIEDFKKNYLKEMTLFEVQNQNRFQIEERFLNFLQEQLGEDKITAFIETLSALEEFQPYVAQWVDAE